MAITGIFWVADGQRALLDLLLKQVLLVEEEDDGGVREPLVVADAVEQLHTLVHPVLRRGGGGETHTHMLITAFRHKPGSSSSTDPSPVNTGNVHTHTHTRGWGAHHLLVLGQHQVVVAECHAEDDGGHALEAMDPLLPLGPLPADVEHPGGRTDASLLKPQGVN